jgi:hypothetical protein
MKYQQQEEHLHHLVALLSRCIISVCARYLFPTCIYRYTSVSKVTCYGMSSIPVSDLSFVTTVPRRDLGPPFPKVSKVLFRR